MKVLHTPVNYGSLASHSVRCLRATDVDARGLILSNSVVQTGHGLKVISINARPPSLRWMFGAAKWVTEFTKAIVAEKPDILHWYFGKAALPFSLDMNLVRGIPRIVEWQGTDIRDPAIESPENPYYRYAIQNGYEANDSTENSHRTQKKFADAGFSCAAPIGMLQYVRRDIFPDVHVIPQRIIIEDYTVSYPDPKSERPLIIHSPSAPVIKGTQAVLDAIEHLRPEYQFDFKLIQNMPRNEAMQWFQQADIILDQFVLGDRGIVALEAMASGKPTVCYLKPSILALYPEDIPIVNATQENLAETLAHLISNPEERHEIGKQSRAYMEKHYQTSDLANTLMSIYEEVIATSR